MAAYKHAQFLERSSHLAFDTAVPRGGTAVFNGIYRCTQCGQEVVSGLGGTLPGECPRKHADRGQDFGWQLVIAAN